MSFKAKPAGTVTYKVEHWQQNVTGNDYTKKEEETKTGKPDETTQAAAKTYEGFTAKAVTQQTIKADGGTVVRIDYDRNLITLTLNLDGGSTTTSLTDGNKLKGRFGADVPAVSDPTKTGCAFQDWKPELPAKFPAQDGTYTAQWEKNKYTVTFDAKDGSPTPAAQTVPYKEKASAPSPVPAKEGHTLEGWYNKEGNTPWNFAVNEVTKNTELYAQWKINEYAVTFSVEGTPANGTLKAMAGSAEITSGKKVPYGTTVTFTATVTAGEHYVDEWTIKGGSFKTGGADGDTTATVQITGETEVKVKFSRYKSVAFGTNGADLAAYLNTGAHASDGNYYIKVTGLTAEHLKGNSGTHESSPLAKILQAYPAKKVALKFGKLPAVTDMYACFKDCRNLIQVPEIPAGVTNMESCFYNCKNLTQAPMLPAGVTNMENCFNGCKNLTQISPFPANAKVTNMNSCFYECESLTQVPALPASVTDMSGCFNKCKNLTQAPALPASVTQMASCFYECAELTKAPSTIPKGVTTMHSCFFNCRKLTKAPVIPKGVTVMKNCFKFCGELTKVTLECNYGISNNFKEAFFSCDKLTAGTIKVPQGQLSAYQAGAGDMGTQADRFYE